VTRASERRLKELVASGIVRLGPHTYGLPDVRRYPGDTAHVHIGSFVSIAERVIIFVGGNHPVDWVSTFPFRVHFQLPGALSDGCPTSKGDVVIGHDVWIGAGATILSGVHIGNGAVVGANSVVTKAVRPYAIAVGNPAREVRRRFSDEEIAALERVAWWDWPTERVVANVHLLSSRDVGAFLEAVTGEGVGRPTTEGLL
jgi:acetyltransferase-like isoleucine patch superfamily enzyme